MKCDNCGHDSDLHDWDGKCLVAWDFSWPDRGPCFCTWFLEPFDEYLTRATV